MARLEAVDGSWLELTPVGYQFPEIEDHYYDSNWLRVEFAGVFPEFSVSKRTAPTLLTSELHPLAHDMARVASGQLRMAILDGIEPALQLRISAASGGFEVAVGVALEFAPERREPFDEAFWAMLRVSKEQLASFAQRLMTELEPYPMRALDSTTR